MESRESGDSSRVPTPFLRANPIENIVPMHESDQDRYAIELHQREIRSQKKRKKPNQEEFKISPRPQKESSFEKQVDQKLKKLDKRSSELMFNNKFNKIELL